MRLLVFPRDANPYQKLLYEEMAQIGVEAHYIGRITPSKSVNILLLPAELVVQRIAGSRVLHLHWVHGFGWRWSHRYPILRSLAETWFYFFLGMLRILGIKLVWTAHNALPHSRVFADEVRARRRLVRASAVVVVHSKTALEELAALDIRPRNAVIIPHGPFPTSAPASSLRVPGSGDGARRFLFFGRIELYKGVDQLLTAFGYLEASGVAAELTVAGACNSALRAKLQSAAAVLGNAVRLRMEWVPDSEVATLFAEADAVVLPFQHVTTSGSALLALRHGRPLIVPDLSAFAELPDGAVLRYSGSVQGLADAMRRLAAADSRTLASMSQVAVQYGAGLSWRQVADETASVLEAVRGRPVTGRRDSHRSARLAARWESQDGRAERASPDRVVEHPH